jgi:hypothetical protein
VEVPRGTQKQIDGPRRVFDYQGAANKKKSVTPVVGGWVRGQKKDWGQFLFDFFIVFLNSPHTEKRPKTH